MSAETENKRPTFDQYAAAYDAALAQGLSVSGEDKSFFAKGRVTWLSRCLNELGEAPESVLDFGCGTGSATPYLFETLKISNLVGVDISAESLKEASNVHGSPRTKFLSFGEYEPRQEVDLAFCNGVFHHIPISERAGAVDFVYRSLRPGGLFAFWENNPWNPGTRYVMSRIPFDRDAVTLTPPESRALLASGRFEILRTDFQFIFPKVLGWFRVIEPHVARLPFGAQYQVLCRKK